MSYKKIVENLVNNGTDNIKKKTITLNNNRPIFSKQDLDVIEGKPKYFGFDKYGRITGAIALLSKNTLPILQKKN